MRAIALLLAAAAITAALAQGAGAEETIRLAQTSTVTNCMMACNSQVANCQTTCVVPTPPTAPPSPSSSSAPALNAAGSTNCLMSCSSLQLTCQTNCARQSPSQ
jgi:hypothetical protein